MTAIFFIIIWIAGIVLANGFWSTTFAIIIPFWGWYLVIELIIKGLLS